MAECCCSITVFEGFICYIHRVTVTLILHSATSYNDMKAACFTNEKKAG